MRSFSRSMGEGAAALLELVIQEVRKLAGRIDQWLMPISNWQWVGSGDILYRHVVSKGGVEFTGELCVDRQTVATYLGSFGDMPREGAVRIADGRYFYAATSEAQRFGELLSAGVQPAQARKYARAAMLSDMRRADECGKTWFNYVLTVSAKRGNRVLAEVSVWGVDAEPCVDCMDVRVQMLFDQLVIEAQREAIEELSQLSSMAMRLS